MSGAARQYAIEAHGDQKYGDRPYVEHLDAVAAILAGWGFGGMPVTVAYLHDVIEDTPVSVGDLFTVFGPRVANAVWAVTGEGATTDERMASIYAKVQKDGTAALVKLADRIANVEAAEPGGYHDERYRREHGRFTAAIKPLVPAHCWARYREAME